MVCEKSGRASRIVEGSGVWASMKDIDGRRRTIRALGCCVRYSLSRYLSRKTIRSALAFQRELDNVDVILFPERYAL